MHNFVPFSSNLKLSSAKDFNLEESIVYRLGKGYWTFMKHDTKPAFIFQKRVYQTIPIFSAPDLRKLLKTLWEKEKMLVTSIFSRCFFTLPQTNCNFCVGLIQDFAVGLEMIFCRAIHKENTDRCTGCCDFNNVENGDKTHIF